MDTTAKWLLKNVRILVGQHDFALPNDTAPSSGGGQNYVMEELIIPVEIGDKRKESVLLINIREANLDVHIQASN